MPFSSFNPKPMKVNSMIQGGIGLAKFTSQESGNRNALVRRCIPGQPARAGETIESFKTVRIGEHSESKCVNTHCDRLHEGDHNGARLLLACQSGSPERSEWNHSDKSSGS